MANAKSLKVIYFDMDGRAEVLRLLLKLAGKEFEDVRVAQEKWPEVKPTMPYGQVPVVEIDGRKRAQSIALANYFAREFKLYGQSNADALTIDTVYQLAEDLIQSFARTFHESDPAKKEAIVAEVKSEVGPRFLGYFEGLLKESGTGLFVGKSITLADLVLFDLVTGYMKQYVVDSVDKFPLVKQLVQTVGENDKIKKYVSTRK